MQKIVIICFIVLGSPLYQVCENVPIPKTRSVPQERNCHPSKCSKIGFSRGPRGNKRKLINVDENRTSNKRRKVDDCLLREENKIPNVEQDSSNHGNNSSQLDIFQALEYLEADESRNDSYIDGGKTQTSGARTEPTKLSKSAKRRLRRKRQAEGGKIEGTPINNSGTTSAYR